MKAAFVLVLVILAILAPMTVLSQRQLAAMHAANAQAERELAAERAKGATIVNSRAEISPEELARLREGNNELIKLRGEVNALKRERDELLKKVAGLESGAARAQQQLQDEKQRAQAVAAATVDAAQAAANNARANTMLGAQNGVLRRKILSGQALTPQEQESLAAIQQKVADLEKNPALFAQYQSSSVASTLGWAANDPRSQQLNDLLSKVAQAANNRGLTFNAPGQTLDTWNDQQKALDNRATTAVKNLLTPEEVAAFDASFPSVLSADPAAGVRTK